MNDNDDNENTTSQSNSNSFLNISDFSDYLIEVFSDNILVEYENGNEERKFWLLWKKEFLIINKEYLKNSLYKLELKTGFNEIEYDFYIFFNKNNDEDENYIAYYSDYILYMCKINFKDLIKENKIDKNKCEEINLKEYVNDKLLSIKYYYKYSKNILICISNDKIILIDIDNKNNINSIYNKKR